MGIMTPEKLKAQSANELLDRLRVMWDIKDTIGALSGGGSDQDFKLIIEELKGRFATTS